VATNFPASLDSLTNPTSSDSLNSPSHSAQHANSNDAIEALQAKVGADSSAVTTSLDYKVAQLEAVSHGKILQVVSTTKTDTFSASIAQGALSAVTGLSATITPSSASSKILVLGQVNAATAVGSFYLEGVTAVLTRGGTAICIGDAAGSRGRGTSSGGSVVAANGLDEIAQSISILFLDSPATTSATTYAVEVGHSRAGTTTVVVNSPGLTSLDRSDIWRTTSTITVLEVSA